MRGVGINTWQKCLDKTKSFSTIDLPYWNEYQLLGYWCHLTKMPFDDEGYYPSRHPQLKKMRIIAWNICQPNADKISTSVLPHNYTAERIKLFLDWTWNELQKTNIPCHSLSIVSGDRQKWFDKWNNTIKTEFNASKLDIGDLL